MTDDPLLMPKTGESPEQRFARAIPLAGTPGQAYVERRGVPIDVAEAAGLLFDSDYRSVTSLIVCVLLIVSLHLSRGFGLWVATHRSMSGTAHQIGAG